MPLSVLIERRITRQRAIVASLKTNLDSLVDGVYEELKDHVPEGMKLTKGMVKAVIASIQQRYETHGIDMEQKDELLDTERGQDTTRSSELEEAKDAGYNLLLDLKSAVSAAYGDAQLRVMRLQGRTPTRTQAIRRQLQHVVSWLQKTENTFPTVTRRFAQALDKATLRKEIEPILAALEKAIKAHALDQRETEAAQIAKDQSTDTFDSTDSQTVDIALALMDMASLHEEADRLKPTITYTRASQSEQDAEAASEANAAKATNETNANEAANEANPSPKATTTNTDPPTP